jgi:hypothetical protein
MPKWWVGWLVIGGPRECLFPFLLRDVGWPNSLKRHPGAVRPNATLTRNNISQVQQIPSSDKINRSDDHETYKVQNQ